jgi:DNA-binding transcriptional ArsR family regulator
VTVGEVGGDDELWEAITDPTRRRLLDALVERGEATATTLSSTVPVTRQAVAKHLAVLERAGLVQCRRHGREVRYEVRQARLAEATEAMSAVASRWDRRLRAIKHLAEQAHAEKASSAGEPLRSARPPAETAQDARNIVD